MVDSAKIAQLIELGISQGDAAAALIQTGNNVEEAISLIFDQSAAVQRSRDSEMQEAISQSLSMDGLEQSNFTGFDASVTDITKNNEAPQGVAELREWPLLGYVLLALGELDMLTEILSESDKSLCSEMLLHFQEQRVSDKIYGNPAAIGNYLISKGNASFPSSVKETVEVIRSVLNRESSDEKAAKIKRILSIPALREAISSTIDYLPCIDMSPFNHDADVRLWLAKTLSIPKTYIFPNDCPQKLMILSFPQLACIRIPLEIFVDRHLKKNAYIMGPKDRELTSKENELNSIQSKKEKLSKLELSNIVEASKFFEKYSNFGSENLSKKLLEYHSIQVSKLKDLDQETLLIRRRMSDIFEVPALQKENLQLFAIFTVTQSQHKLYLLKSHIWWEFGDKTVSRILEEDFLEKEIENISSLWYQSGCVRQDQ